VSQPGGCIALLVSMNIERYNGSLVECALERNSAALIPNSSLTPIPSDAILAGDAGILA